MILAPHFRNSGNLFRNFDRLFDQSFQRLADSQTDLRIRETEHAWNLELDLPGVSRDQLNLEVRRDALLLAVNHGEESEAQNFRIPLGEGVSQSDISAKLELGVLRVSLSKVTPEDQTKKIEIS